MMTDMRDTTLSPEDVLDHQQFNALAEAVADYLSEVTGYCVESLSIGLDVTYTLDTSDEDDEVPTAPSKEDVDAFVNAIANDPNSNFV